MLILISESSSDDVSCLGGVGRILEFLSRNQLSSKMRHFVGTEAKSPIRRSLDEWTCLRLPSLKGKFFFFFFKAVLVLSQV